MYAEHYRIADVEVTIEAPPDLLPIVAESYRRFPKPVDAPAHVCVRIVEEHGLLSMRIADKECASVSAAAGRGLIGLELANTIITAVAQRSRFLIVHAAALERSGNALCIAGRGMSGKTLLATHLIARGWRILSDEYAFIEPLSGHIVPFPKLLFVRSSSLPHMPRSFRKAVEFSPWYGLGDLTGIVFSGVDPAISYSDSIWSSGGRLTHMLFLTARGARPQIDAAAPWSLIPDLNAVVWQPPDILEALSRLATAMRGVRTGRLSPGVPVLTANAIEHWISPGFAQALTA